MLGERPNVASLDFRKVYAYATPRFQLVLLNVIGFAGGGRFRAGAGPSAGFDHEGSCGCAADRGRRKRIGATESGAGTSWARCSDRDGAGDLRRHEQRG